MDITRLYEAYLENRIISTDSRNITPGCMFFALKGDHFNGNAFAREAIEKGASLAVVDEDLPVSHSQIFRVDDVLSALQRLATFHRIHTGITLIAITGSNGKTTTKELCRAVLAAKHRVRATEGNLNNHIGVPLTLLAMESDLEIGIVEMGANHPGEIKSLCEIARPDYGLITNIGKAHLEGFGGIEGVARAKGELYDHLMQHGKSLFLNEGNPYLSTMVPDSYEKVIRYNGVNSLKVISQTSNPLLNLKIGKKEDTLEIATQLIGGYNAENVLAACCVGTHFGVSSTDIAKAIHHYQPTNNRSQLIRTGRNTVYMDAYNANPSSMEAALQEFLQQEGGQKLVILGEMREVGDASPYEHERILAFLKERNVNKVICVGKGFEQPSIHAGFRHAATVEQLGEILLNEPVSGHLVFIKGSRGNRLEKLIPLL